MRTSFQPAFVPSTALARAAVCTDDELIVTFSDGRVLHVPLLWFPLLNQATPSERANCQICGGGISLHWPEIDEDLSIAGLMAGVDLRSA